MAFAIDLQIQTTPAAAVDEPPPALCSLPVFRPVVVRMLQCLGREDASLSEITELVQSDPALGAEMLAFANSAVYGCSASVRTVKHAIAMLGTERVRKLATAIAMKAYLRNGSGKGELVRSCWAHSLASAVICEELTSPAHDARALAHVCALVHEVGRLGTLLAYPHDYALAVEKGLTDSQAILKRERAVLGFDHCTAGLWLTRAWLLPQELRDANARHHEDPGDQRDVVSRVAASCALANVLGFPETAPCEEVRPLEEIEAHLPASMAEALHGRLGELQERINLTIRSIGY